MIDDLKNNLEDVSKELVGKHGRKLVRIRRLWRKSMRFFGVLNDDCVGLYAAQSAFFTILSAVPFIMLILICLNLFVEIDVREVVEPIIKVLPKTVALYVRQIITETIYRSQSIAVVSVAVVAMLWSSSRGTMSIYSGLNRIFGYEKEYLWIRARLLSLLYNCVFVIATVTTLVILIFGNSLFGLLDSGFLLVHYILVILFKLKYLVFFVAFALAFAAVYTILPQRKTTYKSQLIGAVVASAGWIAFSYVFSLYIEYFSRYSMIYGSLTALALLMLWVYFCQYMFLLGAEINKYIQIRKQLP